VNGIYRGLLIAGVLLTVVGGVIVLADSDDQSAKMPTQVIPRRYARYPLGAGIVLLLVGLVGLLFA
jgi:hypothetical protein